MYDQVQFVLLSTQNNGISRNLPAVSERFMSIITLTSDYGITDHDVAVFKGQLLSGGTDVRIVDISHEVSPYNIMQAAYLAERSYMRFPEGSIHMILVDAEQGSERPPLVARINNRYFIAGNNGILSLIHPQEEWDSIIAVDLRNSGDIHHVEDIFAKTAAHIGNGGKIEVLGRPPGDFVTRTPSRPSVRQDGSGIIANVLHIDTFGNLVTNVSRKWLSDKAGNHRIVIVARNKRITRLVDSYFEGPTEGELFGVFNRDGMLEIAVQRPAGRDNNSAWSLLGLQVNSNIFIEFE